MIREERTAGNKMRSTNHKLSKRRFVRIRGSAICANHFFHQIFACWWSFVLNTTNDGTKSTQSTSISSLEVGSYWTESTLATNSKILVHSPQRRSCPKASRSSPPMVLTMSKTCVVSKSISRKLDLSGAIYLIHPLQLHLLFDNVVWPFSLPLVDTS
jgi:hypothetical protein